MFDMFNLGWPEGIEDAIIITTLTEEEELVCPRCGIKLTIISKDLIYCKSCNARYQYKGN